MRAPPRATARLEPWRFADHQAAAHAEKWRAALRDDGRRAERARHDEVELRPVPRIIAPASSAAAVHDGDPLAETEPLDRVRQEHRPALARLQQDPPRRRPPPRERKTRDATARTEVEREIRRRHGVAERPSVSRCPRPAPGPRKPSRCARRHSTSTGSIASFRAQLVAAGRITTRRRGSSPSDVVETPSSSLTTSWTTLRSAGCIGSSALGTPEDADVRRDLLREPLERLAPPLPVTGDVDADPPVMGPGRLPLHDRAGELLDRLQGLSLRADQQAEVLAFDPQLDRVVVDLLLADRRVEVECLDQPVEEGPHDGGLLLHRHVVGHLRSFLCRRTDSLLVGRSALAGRSIAIACASSPTRF